MSEWLEAGPSLQPNIKDGFEYLKQIKKTIKDVKPCQQQDISSK